MRTQKSKPTITKAAINKLSVPATGNRIVFDVDPPGFGVRTTANGVKSFVLRYRNKNGVERRMTIGRCDVRELEAARKEAKSILYGIEKDGVDPLETQKAVREALTVNDMLDEYVASARFATKAANTQKIDRARLERHVRPLLGKRILMELSPNHIERAFADISGGKTRAEVKTRKHGLARVTGGVGTARKAIRLLKAALAWAVREKLVPTNAASGVELGRDGVRKLILESDGYSALFATLDRLEAAGEVRTMEADAIRIIALTGARRGEVCGLLRKHVDLNAGLIVLPPAGHKTGKATGDERIIGLDETSVAILKKYDNQEVVFPFEGTTLTRTFTLIRDEAKLPRGFGLHGLRHSVASHLAMSGAGAAEIMTALGHRQMETSAKYIHWAQDSRAKLATRAAGPAVAGMGMRR